MWLLLILLFALSGCEAATDWGAIATSEAMRIQRENGAIVRQEMRDRGEVPVSSWPWAGRP